LGLVRVNRFVGAYDPGRVINPKTARSHAIGGIWGVGQALLEQSDTDPVLGRFLNRNYSRYLVPTNADIPHLDILFVGDFDEEASPLGAKGLGELTAASVAPAIAQRRATQPASECETCRSRGEAVVRRGGNTVCWRPGIAAFRAPLTTDRWPLEMWAVNRPDDVGKPRVAHWRGYRSAPPSGRGYFHGAYNGMDVSVKDSKKFARCRIPVTEARRCHW
jgi:hypothetical protein